MFGKVRWFNPSKGYGFILANEQDYFVHFSDIIADGYKSLNESERVEFEPAVDDRNRLKATKVQVIK